MVAAVSPADSGYGVPIRAIADVERRTDTDELDDGDVRYAWRVLAITGLGILLTGLNTSTLNVALPVVARHFHASATEASWLLLSYLLVNTVLILTFGRLADIVGRRTLYIGGLALLIVACLASGFAPNALTLIGLRSLQAVGAAAIIANTTALLTDAFPRRLLSTGLGGYVTIISAAQLLGPVVGGFLAETTGWRGVFWFNVPIGVIGLIWALTGLRKPVQAIGREPFDLVGAALSLLVIGGLVVAMSEGGAVGWWTPQVVVGAAAFVVATPVFLWWQRRARHPLLDLRLFDERERAMAYVAAFLLSAARYAVVLLTALYVQAASGESAFVAGVQVVPIAVGMMITSPLVGRLARTISTRVLCTGGLALVGAGLLVLAITLTPGTPVVLITVCLAAIGAGTGLFQTPNTSAIMTSVSADRRGIANGLRSMLQNAGFVISTALSLAIVTGPLRPRDKAAAYAGQLSTLHGGDLSTFTSAYHVAFGVLAGLTALALFASAMRNARTSAPASGEVAALRP